MTVLKISKKSRIIISVSILVLGLLICGGSLAFFTSHDEVTNQFNSKTLSIELREPDWDSTGYDMAQKAVPGMVIPKDPYIYNNSDAAVYVRMKVELEIDGQKYTSGDLYERMFSYIYLNNGTNDDLFFDTENNTCNNSDFVYYDGYFYYASNESCKILKPHSSTPKLFDCVKLPVLKTEYNGFFDKNFTIKVIAEGVSTSVVSDPKIEECADKF